MSWSRSLFVLLVLASVLSSAVMGNPYGQRRGPGGGNRRGRHARQAAEGDEGKKCFYDVLGLPKDASKIQIKKAYRKLSLTYHPDKNPGKEEEAKVMFMQVGRAYEVLGNEEMKARYDRFGHAGVEQGEGSGPGGFGGDPFDMFQEFFGGGGPFGGGGGFGDDEHIFFTDSDGPPPGFFFGGDGPPPGFEFFHDSRGDEGHGEGGDGRRGGPPRGHPFFQMMQDDDEAGHSGARGRGGAGAGGHPFDLLFGDDGPGGGHRGGGGPFRVVFGGDDDPDPRQFFVHDGDEDVHRGGWGMGSDDDMVFVDADGHIGGGLPDRGHHGGHGGGGGDNCFTSTTCVNNRCTTTKQCH